MVSSRWVGIDAQPVVMIILDMIGFSCFGTLSFSDLNLVIPFALSAAKIILNGQDKATADDLLIGAAGGYFAIAGMVQNGQKMDVAERAVVKSLLLNAFSIVSISFGNDEEDPQDTNITAHNIAQAIIDNTFFMFKFLKVNYIISSRKGRFIFLWLYFFKRKKLT